MAFPPMTVAPDEMLDAAIQLMEQKGVHHLLVVDAGRMVGILSSSDLLKLALLRQPAEPASADCAESLGLRVRDVMQSRVAVLRDNASLKEVARALMLGGIHALPILARDDTPVGIVTTSDLAALIVAQIERRSTHEEGVGAGDPAMRRLLDVLRAAEVYLHSGQSEQQNAQLQRAVARAREAAGGESFLRL